MNFIGVDVNMLQMKPLGTREIIAFVNCFMIRNVQLVQSFISSVEQRIIEMEKRLNQVEVELKLLELKLDSVPDLQITVPKVSEFSTKQHDNGLSYNKISAEDILEDETIQDAKLDNSESLHASSPAAFFEKPLESTVSKASSAEQIHRLLIRDDPRYATYFKMLKMGVPECAVKQKMVSEGVDTTLLQTPDAFSDLLENATANSEGKGLTNADDDDQNSTSSSDR